MKLNKRQRQILKSIREDGFGTISDLSTRFDVTPQTVRRDINRLCDEGHLVRYHGGATVPQSSVENLAYSARQVLNHDAKRRIGRAVAAYIPHHASLFINIGTTTEEVAGALTEHRGLRVITNNLNVANTLCESESCEVIIAAGVVRNRDRGIIGEATTDFIRQFKVDYGVIGISGIDLDGTLLDYDYREVRVAQSIIENSRHVLLVADHSKFARNALVRLGSLDEVDAIFTDEPIPDEMADVVAQSGTDVRVAGR
jgi:DeoR family glycerol-3-phosphate regulon repressor